MGVDVKGKGELVMMTQAALVSSHFEASMKDER